MPNNRLVLISIVDLFRPNVFIFLYSWFSTTEAVYLALYETARHSGHRVPYAMIQPTLVNRKEYKVVVLGGKPAHICPTAKGVAKAFSTPPEIMQFAEDAVKELKKARPATIDDGLLRVDIMSTRDNRMVVNEFESLEAAVSVHTYATMVHSVPTPDYGPFAQVYGIKSKRYKVQAAAVVLYVRGKNQGL